MAKKPGYNQFVRARTTTNHGLRGEFATASKSLLEIFYRAAEPVFQ